MKAMDWEVYGFGHFLGWAMVFLDPHLRCQVHPFMNALSFNMPTMHALVSPLPLFLPVPCIVPRACPCAACPYASPRTSLAVSVLDLPWCPTLACTTRVGQPGAQLARHACPCRRASCTPCPGLRARCRTAVQHLRGPARYRASPCPPIPHAPTPCPVLPL